MFDVPNLDGLSVDPDDYDRTAKVFTLLATYSNLKSAAMKARLAGKIPAAIEAESACENIYIQLPTWARW